MRTALPSALPDPDPAARAHSAAVTAKLHALIDEAGGFITFEHYMQHVLYAPGLGYYTAGARKFGPDGDFVTAPEMTPLFGATLASQVAPILAATRGRQLVELGAGSGALAADLLNALAARDALPAQYLILDVSPDLRERQQATLAARAPAHVARVTWLDALPATIDGSIVMNEVLDAIPPRLVVRRGGEWFERGVIVSPAFAWSERPLHDTALVGMASERFPPDIDYASDINPAAEALVSELARRLHGGAMLIVDYGYPQREYYQPDRGGGTLLAHYRHRATADPFVWPGLADLTTHVDFTAIALAGVDAGLSLAGFATQGTFLVNAGVLDALRDTGEPTSSAYLRAASAVQKLLAPMEMGEIFKVLALARSEVIAWPGFAQGDRSHKL